MKMFTQWMGETTGIISIDEDKPNEYSNTAQAQDVSFEAKVYGLEKFYKYMYDICKASVSDERIEKMAAEYEDQFKMDKRASAIDFNFLRTLRPSFDKLFRTSITPLREGYSVTNNPSAKVIRFNSSRNPVAPCGAADCRNCQHKNDCKRPGNVRNKYGEFVNAVNKFFDDGIAFYKTEKDKFSKAAQNLKMANAGGRNSSASIENQLDARREKFVSVAKQVKAMLPPVTTEPFTMPFEKYLSVFNPIKELYWDAVVYKYLGPVVDQFHKQCDTVLDGARSFERFVKILAIADFMKNMEGTV
jgi:hypothetical protein